MKTVNSEQKREPATLNLKLETWNLQRGQALPLLVLVLVLALIPATGYMVDFGFMYRAKSFAQNMADAGAYAGVHELVKRVGTGTGGGIAATPGPEGEFYSTRVAKISGTVMVASNYLTTNGLKSTDSWVVDLGEWDNADKTFSVHDSIPGTGSAYTLPGTLRSFLSGYPTNAIRVTVTYNTKFFFSQIIGRKDTDVKATAIVRFGRAANYNVIPIGLGDRQFYCYNYQKTHGSCPNECNSGPPANTDYCTTDPFTTELRLWATNNSSTAPGFKGVLNFDWRWWSDKFVHDVDETGAKDQNDNDDDDDSVLDASDVDDDADGERDVSVGGSPTPLDDADEDTDRDGIRDEDDGDDDADTMADNVDPDDDNDGITDANDPSHEDYDTEGTPYEMYSARTSGWFGRNPIIYGDPSTVVSDMRNNAWNYIADGYPRSNNPSNPNDPLLLKAEQRADVFTGAIAGSVRDSLVGSSTTSYPSQNPQPGSYVYEHGVYTVIPLIDFYESQGTNGNWFITRFALVRVTQTDAQSAYIEVVNGIISASIDETKQILYDANGNIIDSVGGDVGIFATALVK